jgi:trigger factor
MKKVEQGVQARDKALEVLLGRIDVPLPEKIVEAEVQNRMHAMEHQLQSAGLTKEGYLASEGQSVEDFDAEVAQRSRDAVKAQFVLDAIVTRRSSRSTSPSCRTTSCAGRCVPR